MVIKGLQDYGYEDLATRLSAIYLANMSRVLSDTGTIWENYAPEFARGHGVKDMVGWSGDGPIALLIENILGIRTTASDHKLFWRPRLMGRNGVENLTVGSAKVSMIASKVVFKQRELAVTSTEPFTLMVDTGEFPLKKFEVKRGENRFSIESSSSFTLTYPVVVPPSKEVRATPADLAYGKSVVASSVLSPEFSAKMAVDQSGDTAWKSHDAAPQSLTVDLGGIRPLGFIHVYWGDEYASKFSIEGSADGSSWVVFYSSESGKGGDDYVPVIGKGARYVRLKCAEGDGKHTLVAVKEIQIFGR
jgi:hypothetical protein